MTALSRPTDPLPVLCERCHSIHCIVRDGYGQICLLCGYEPNAVATPLPLVPKLELMGERP